jgi:hypothetical protein
MSNIPLRAPQLHLNPRALQELMAQMRGDTKFQILFGQFHEYRESAIADLCNDAVVGDTNKVFAAIGEIRAYTTILSLAGSEAAPSIPVAQEESE